MIDTCIEHITYGKYICREPMRFVLALDTHKSSHLYLYSTLYNTYCFKAASQW